MNKKLILMSIILSITSIFIGVLLGFNLKFETGEKIIGTYRTTSWNGKEAVISLKNDNSCIYLNTNYICTWLINSDEIVMELTENNHYIEIYLSSSATEEDIQLLENDLRTISIFVKKFTFYSTKKMFVMELMTENSMNEVYNTIVNSKYNIIEKLNKFSKEEFKSNEKATIVDRGLIHEGNFFEKITIENYK